MLRGLPHCGLPLPNSLTLQTLSYRLALAFALLSAFAGVPLWLVDYCPVLYFPSAPIRLIIKPFNSVLPSLCQVPGSRSLPYSMSFSSGGW